MHTHWRYGWDISPRTLYFHQIELNGLLFDTVLELLANLSKYSWNVLRSTLWRPHVSFLLKLSATFSAAPFFYLTSCLITSPISKRLINLTRRIVNLSFCFHSDRILFRGNRIRIRRVQINPVHTLRDSLQSTAVNWEIVISRIIDW